MNNKRFFSFGCSFSSWYWPTWNDYIGVNFKEYYNFARGGADNKFIQYKFLKANEKCKFTKDDYVVVMFSSFNRMSFINKKGEIETPGDLDTENIESSSITANYNFETAIYDSFTAIKSVQTILESIGVKYDLLQALPHDFMIYELPHIGRIAKRELESCLELFTYPVLDDWRYENFDAENDRICWKDEMLFDSHPTIEHHLAFVKEFFPQFITEKSMEFYNLQKKEFTTESSKIQAKIYNKIKNKFFKEEKIIIDLYE